MPKGSVAILPLSFALSACVSHSTAADVGSVRDLVHERASLELAAARAPRSEETDRDVHALLAQPLSLENAIRIALLNNHELRASLLELGIARGQLVQASLFPNPEFDAEVRFAHDRGEGPQLDFGAGIDLTRMILRGKREDVAEAELDAARFRAAGAALDLGYQVRLAYYDVQASEQQRELLATAVAAFQASFETAEALHDAGNLTDFDLATQQSAYEGARVALAEAEAARIDAIERLNVLLGFYGADARWELGERMRDPGSELGPLDRLESRAIAASLELAEARARMSAAARRVGLTQEAGWLPDLNLGVHAARDGTDWEIGPALRGRLPLFDRQQGNVISSQAELDGLRERYVASAIGIRAATRAARARALSAEARARSYHDVLLPLRERVVKEAMLQYNAMQISVFQLLQARRDQLDAGRAYVATLREYWRARAALEQLLAGRLSDSLFARSENPRVMPPVTPSSDYGAH